MTREHCRFHGDLLPELAGLRPTGRDLDALLQNRHPVTGEPLRGFLSGHVRITANGNRLPARVLGIDCPVTVDRTLSVAALVLRDNTVLNEVAGAFNEAGASLAGLADRRLPGRKKWEVTPTEKAIAVTILEKADRSGAPHLHIHPVIPNLTAGNSGYCAIEYGRIMRGHSAIELRCQRRLFHRLRAKGYSVEFKHGRCRLKSIPRELLELWPEVEYPPELRPPVEALSANHCTAFKIELADSISSGT